MIRDHHFSRNAESLSFPSDDHQVLSWLESRSKSNQKQLTYERLDFSIKEASQSRHASGNACLKLSYFVQQCRKSESVHVQDAIRSMKAFEKILEFYLQWNEKNRNRSMRQILEIIASLNSYRPQSEKNMIIEKLLAIVTQHSASHLAKSAFKALECFISKGSMSVEDLMRVYEDRCTRLTSGSLQPSSQVEPVELLISDVFLWMTLPDVAPAAGKFLVTIFSNIRGGSARPSAQLPSRSDLWQQSISRGLEKFPEALENVKNYLFPSLFTFDRSGSISFLQGLNRYVSQAQFDIDGADSDILFQLAALGVGKKAGLVDEPTVHFRNIKEVSESVILHEEAVGSLIAHHSESVRSLAFSVLVSSSSSIRPFRSEALEIFKSHMRVLYADTDAKIRSDIISTTKNLVERLRGAASHLSKACPSFDFSIATNSTSVNYTSPEVRMTNETEDLLLAHIAFLQWFQQFLSKELVPTASYQRHITALKAITLLVRSGVFRNSPDVYLSKNVGYATVWPYKIDLFTPCMQRLLFDLVIDPFEDVRSAATSLLKLVHPFSIPPKISDNDSGKPEPQAFLLAALARAKDISERTGRANSADGLAHLHELQYQLAEDPLAGLALVEALVEDLESKVGFAHSDLTKAVLVAPVHGVFAALRYVWTTVNKSGNVSSPSSEENLEPRKKSEQLQRRIISCCYRIWDAVRDVLCNDSPEGHLPEDLDEGNDIDTKDVLSYSFRAIHESSQLMRTLIGEANLRSRDEVPTLPADLFERAANLSFQQLACLRHRGAFSTVSLTFARLCQLAQLKESRGDGVSSLLQKYLNDALGCLYEQPSTTRRSAGLPMLMAGILSAIPKTIDFQHAVKSLKAMSKEPLGTSSTDGTHYPQVHALNCLRHIFQSSSVGPYVENEIEDCLEIAVSCQKSNVWPIRNSGLLLLRSLVDRLLGTRENKSSIEMGWDGESTVISYENYPGLPSLLLDLLNADSGENLTTRSSESHLVESVFPALDIIRRAGPPNSSVDEITQAVLRHLGSNIWNIREIAARTASTLFVKASWTQIMAELEFCWVATAGGAANRKHGAIMTLKFVLEQKMLRDVKTTAEGLKDLVPRFEQLTCDFLRHDNCQFILSEVVEIQATIARILLAAADPVELFSVDSLFCFIINSLFPSDGLEQMYHEIERYRKVTKVTDNEASLFFNSVVRRAMYVTGIKGGVASIRKILKYALDMTEDVILVALEAIPVAWGKRPLKETFIFLSEAYLNVIAQSTSAKVRAAALLGLVEILDKQLRQFRFPDAMVIDAREASTSQWLWSESIKRTSDIGALLQTGEKSPSLSNNEILASGSLLLLDLVRDYYQTGRLCDSLLPRVQAWGKLMIVASDAENDFDTRCAVARALKAFFDKSYFERLAIENDCLLPGLLALYDLLNDDDDEIRDLAAQTASSILEMPLVPLAAQNELIKYLSVRYTDRLPWAWNVIRRVTGNRSIMFSNHPIGLCPASIQFERALKQNDDLFMQEKQNLFIDEVRETKQWMAPLELLLLSPINTLGDELAGKQSIQDAARTEPYAALSKWTLEALLELNRVVEELKYDGPLGWTFKPEAFTICMTILLCAATLLKIRGEPLSAAVDQSLAIDIFGEVGKEVDKFLSLGRANAIHPFLLSVVEDVKKL